MLPSQQLLSKVASFIQEQGKSAYFYLGNFSYLKIGQQNKLLKIA